MKEMVEVSCHSPRRACFRLGENLLEKVVQTQARPSAQLRLGEAISFGTMLTRLGE